MALVFREIFFGDVVEATFDGGFLAGRCSLHISNIFLSLEGEKHLSCLSFENRATPKSIRAGTGEMCVRRILKEPRPLGYADSVSPV